MLLYSEQLKKASEETFFSVVCDDLSLEDISIIEMVIAHEQIVSERRVIEVTRETTQHLVKVITFVNDMSSEQSLKDFLL